MFGFHYTPVRFFCGVMSILVQRCFYGVISILVLSKLELRDNCIQNFHLGRYIVGYTDGK